MKRLLPILVVLLSLTIQAQDSIRISGHVFTEDGLDAIGAYLAAYDTDSNVIASDLVGLDGLFKLEFNSGKKASYIEVSYENFQPDIIVLTNAPDQKYSIVLKPMPLQGEQEVDTIPGYDFSKIKSMSESFFADWNEESKRYALSQSIPSLDSLFQYVFLRYFRNSGDTCKYQYIVLPHIVPITIYNTDFVGDSYFFDPKNKKYVSPLEGYNLYMVSKDSAYIPHLNVDEPVLYLFKKQNKKISSYLGGIPGRRRIRIERVVGMSKYMQINYGHWGGYWHLETMPIINKICIFNNGTYILLRDSWHTGRRIFIPLHSERIDEVARWVE